MNNKDLLLERVLLNMKYDSKKTLYENKIILNEVGPTPLTFNGPSTKNLTQTVKYTTIGKILSKVSDNLSELKEVSYNGDIMIINGKKHLNYDNGKQLTYYNEHSLEQCIKERFAGGKGAVKSWDYACLAKRTETLNALEKQRHTFCLSKILNNQSLLNLPFAIQVTGTKTDQFGDSNNGTYKILFLFTGEDCEYNGFNWYFDSPNYTFLNYDYPLQPLSVGLIAKPKEQPKPVVKKVEQKVGTPKLTPEQQKKWCADRGKVWSDEVGACVGKEITLDSSKMEIQKKEKEKESTGGLGTKGTTPSTGKGLGGYSFDLD
jgi:hypothetical protein